MNKCLKLKRAATHLLRATSCYLHHSSSLTAINKLTDVVDGESSKILGHTSLLLQDGLDIRELPLVIRRMQAFEFPSISEINTRHFFEKPSNQDEAFKQHLQDCSSVSQVIKLLEIPDDRVSSFSAAYALIRLSQLQDGNATDCDSFIRKAVLKELCDTAMIDQYKFDNATIISLVKYYLLSENHSSSFIKSINEEVEHRIGSGTFSIDNLCTLISHLSNNIQSDMDLLRNTWIHLGSRYREISENNIGRVFSVLRNISKNQRYILNLLDNRIQIIWWKLSSSDVATICSTLTHLGIKSTNVFNCIPKWLICNIQGVSDKKMADILAAYSYFNIYNSDFMEILERYVTARINKLDKTFVAMCMGYCYKVRVLMPKLMNTVAEDFVANHSQYDIIELYNVIRTFGYLNYSPSNSASFFNCVDRVLQDNFNGFHPSQIIELLTTFTYIKRFPVNFLNNIFNANFLSKVQKDEHALEFLQQLYIAVLLEVPVEPPSFLNFLYIDKKFYNEKNAQWNDFHQEIGNILHKMYASDIVLDGIASSSFYAINYILTVGSDGRLIKPGVASMEDKQIAIVSVMPDEVCSNNQNMLGSTNMRMRHLQLIGFSVIDLHYTEFMWSCKTDKERSTLLRKFMAEHLK